MLQKQGFFSTLFLYRTQVRLEKRIDDFEEDNNFSEKYYEDFSGLYFMMLWTLMKNGASKDEVRMMQAKGYSYADDNYKRVK